MKQILNKKDIFIDLNKISKENIKLILNVLSEKDNIYVDDSINFRKGLYIKKYPKLIFENDKWICTKIKYVERKEVDFNELLMLAKIWNI